MDLTYLKTSIQEMACAHGFVLCRFTRPEFPDRHRTGLEHWVEAGMQGEMGYMAEPLRKERRKFPKSLLSGVRSVVTVALRHSPPPALEEVSRHNSEGVIAAYACGDDYHEVMKKRLKGLAADLDRLLGRHDQRVFVDTAPVLEHAFAEQAGLGWQGKHTLTINREQGSYLLLGEIFTTADIEPDEPASFHCGSCTACMDVCPTQAIVAPFVVDARLCISYLTIEYQGYIPAPIRPLMGNRIFGCDDCQAICPWNRRATPPEPDLLAPRGENIFPGLASLFALDEDAFRARFRKSPVKRTGRAGLLRNVAIAMGNSADSGFIQPLLGALSDAEPLVRGHSAWALGRLAKTDGSRRMEIMSAIQQALASEGDVQVAEELRTALDQIRKST